MIAVQSRDPHRAAAFSAWASSIGVAAAEPGACSVVINATPLGLSASDALPVDVTTLPAGTILLDLVYKTEGTTAIVRACQAIGMRAVDGRTVLLAQGAASWRIWLPGVTPPLEVMRAALDGRLV
jgi:shikimate dehydrogenase